MKNSLVIDYHSPYWLAVIGTIFSPLILYFLGFHHLLSLMGLLGAVLGALQGWIILAIFLKARKKGDRQPEYHIKRVALTVSYMVFTLVAVIAFQVVALLKG